VRPIVELAQERSAPPRPILNSRLDPSRVWVLGPVVEPDGSELFSRETRHIKIWDEVGGETANVRAAAASRVASVMLSQDREEAPASPRASSRSPA